MTDPNGIISNNPGKFVPNAAGLANKGRGRGRRFRLLLYTIAGVVALIVATEVWVRGGRDVAIAKTEVRETHAQIPGYQLPPAEVVVPPPPPAPETPPEVKKPPPRPIARGQGRGPQLPTSVAFNVKVTGAEPDQSWFTDGRRPMLAYGCALRPGASQIHAVLESVIQSEVAGQVMTSVSEDVKDADGVGRLLIPQGTKLVGIYKNDLTFQSRRLPIVWTEAVIPDGTQLTLDDANGMDVAGSMGVGGEVNTRWGELLAVAALFTVFDAANRMTIPDNSWGGAFGDTAANNFARVGRDATKKILDSAVTIKIESGTQIVVSPSKTVQVCDG